MKNIFIIIIVLLGAAALLWHFEDSHIRISPSMNTANQNLEIPPVTTPPATSEPVQERTVTVALGQELSMSGVRGMVTEVLEDSRCPANANCIQMGTVRVNVRATYGALSQNVILTLNQPYALNGRSITLVDVLPQSIAGVKIAPSDYRFTFSLK